MATAGFATRKVNVVPAEILYYHEKRRKSMTNQQLYLAIGIPVLMVLFNTTVLFTLFMRLDNRIDRLESKMDARFEKVDARFEKVERRLDLIQGDLTQFYAEQRVHKEAIDTLKGKVQ